MAAARLALARQWLDRLHELLPVEAIKYSDPAKPDSFIEIALCAHSGPDQMCTFCVRDNGLGIPEADQPAIFDRFFRAHAHLDRELGVSGTGLGLAIAVECVQALGGSIRCESTVGEGTTFFVSLPCNEPGTAAGDTAVHATPVTGSISHTPGTTRSHAS